MSGGFEGLLVPESSEHSTDSNMCVDGLALYLEQWLGFLLGCWEQQSWLNIELEVRKWQ